MVSRAVSRLARPLLDGTCDVDNARFSERERQDEYEQAFAGVERRRAHAAVFVCPSRNGRQTGNATSPPLRRSGRSEKGQWRATRDDWLVISASDAETSSPPTEHPSRHANRSRCAPSLAAALSAARKWSNNEISRRCQETTLARCDALGRAGVPCRTQGPYHSASQARHTCL